MVRPVFSHSRLASFENCPKQFEFRYLKKLPAESEGVEAFVGRRVHQVLERLYRFVGRGLLPSLPKVLSRYNALWDESFDPERVRIVREGVPVDFYRALGERCLRNYYLRHYPFDADETLAIEERLVFDLDHEGDYRMQGIVDRLVRAEDGAIEIHDYKTGQRVPSQKKLDEDRQLALYQIGVAQRYPGAAARLVWHFVASGQVRTSLRSAEQLDELRRRTIERIDEIGREARFEPNPSPLCRWCEYRQVCPAWNEGRESAPACSEALPSWTQLDLL